jgi:hypothetical protein
MLRRPSILHLRATGQATQRRARSAQSRRRNSRGASARGATSKRPGAAKQKCRRSISRRRSRPQQPSTPTGVSPSAPSAKGESRDCMSSSTRARPATDRCAFRTPRPLATKHSEGSLGHRARRLYARRREVRPVCPSLPLPRGRRGHWPTYVTSAPPRFRSPGLRASFDVRTSLSARRATAPQSAGRREGQTGSAVSLTWHFKIALAGQFARIPLLIAHFAFHNGPIFGRPLGQPLR